MYRDSNGLWVQEHAGESVAASHANGMELERRQKFWESVWCSLCAGVYVNTPTFCSSCGRELPSRQQMVLGNSWGNWGPTPHRPYLFPHFREANMPENKLSSYSYRSDVPNLVLTWESILFNDDSVEAKLAAGMDKWEIMADDGRNEDKIDVQEEVDKFLKLGKKYRITLILEELEQPCQDPPTA